MHDHLVNKIGTGAAVAAAAETALFAESLVLGMAVKSAAGPIAGFIVSFFLAPSVVVMMAAAYYRTPADRKIVGLLALAAAVLYAPFCMGNYLIQLAVVSTNPIGIRPETLKLISFIPGSPAFALDMLGYAFLCLTTLAAAFTLPDPRDRALRVLCLVHGALVLPTLAAPVMSGMYRSGDGGANDIGNWVLLFWCAIYAPIAVLFARYFGRKKT
ncbi:MAG: hypothetical protein JXD23_08680 [Spirochaetales bacterium]|nr:hypothetical protein [Spirochaetales bacterium]